MINLVIYTDGHPADIDHDQVEEALSAIDLDVWSITVKPWAEQ